MEYVITPSPTFPGMASSSDYELAREILSGVKIESRWPAAIQFIVELDAKVPAKTLVSCAHGWWNTPSFKGITPPPGLPCVPSDELCPTEMLRVTIRAIRQWSDRMGSAYHFRGYFVSLLISPTRREIWDARGERAD